MVSGKKLLPVGFREKVVLLWVVLEVRVVVLDMELVVDLLTAAGRATVTADTGVAMTLLTSDAYPLDPPASWFSNTAPRYTRRLAVLCIR